MIKKISRNEMRKVRHERLRKSLAGTKDVPRLSVYRSNKNIFAQLIDDENNVTLASASSLKMDGNNKDTARQVGVEIAKKAKELKITKVVFDRGGYLYHGRVASLADAARENGLDF